MVHIKRLVLKGFKSFPKETAIDFTDSMNVIVGPNGSGKSNLTDAICFVLGKLSIKSMRAEKSANLIFLGTKQYKPAQEASVKLIFDNTDKTFFLPDKEVSIEKLVRKTGQSIYKINNQTKTRQEVLELLGQAGIDPNGFNIVLQGEIDSIVKMHPEERRGIIEEVAGISIYELRKEKSLRELEKTDEKLKQVEITLGERTVYLKTLEEERKQALKFKKLQQDKNSYKASIIKRRLIEKKRKISSVEEQRDGKDKEKAKLKGQEQEIMKKISELEEEIKKINSQVQKSSGIQQENLNREISDLRAELAGLDVRKTGEVEKIDEVLSKITELEKELKIISGDPGQIKKIRKELQDHIQRLEDLNLKRENQEKEISVYEAEISNLDKIKKQVSKLDVCPLCKSKITKQHVKKVFSECNQKIFDLIGKSEENKKSIKKFIKEIQTLQEEAKKLQDNIPQIEIKEKTFEDTKLEIKNLNKQEQDLKESLEEIEKDITEKETLLGKREEEAKALESKFKKLIETKTSKEREITNNNLSLLEQRSKIGNFDNEINNLKIEMARLDAEKQALETDFFPYKDVQIINLPEYTLQERLEKTQRALEDIGSVNLRALDVYDKVKGEYDRIAEKVTVINKEKVEILKIIEEIDKKKKRTFMKTLKSVSELFNRNFSQLYIKGEAFLELENKEEPFAGGLDIVIKIGKGKYFDVTSLSGGEKTLVALSLIFAIQEYKPYCFYIFDEVDATLDKRNSERLAVLIKRYMKTGQYIVITHNDAIISESNVLYGVSMQEGLSKILSLPV